MKIRFNDGSVAVVWAANFSRHRTMFQYWSEPHDDPMWVLGSEIEIIDNSLSKHWKIFEKKSLDGEVFYKLAAPELSDGEFWEKYFDEDIGEELVKSYKNKFENEC